jgi:hypothetical protein
MDIAQCMVPTNNKLYIEEISINILVTFYYSSQPSADIYSINHTN